ncbi:MAG: hypothetical protein GY864_03425 [Desulfobacterales bacterium]|nr:hypothetical protein [Desulfobacterales bacterium]
MRRNRSGTFIAYIPKKTIVNIAKLLGILAYFLDRRHRRIVKRNLKFTHPEWSEDHIQKFSRLIFQNMGTTFLEICQMTCFSKEEILNGVQIRGEEFITNALKTHKGIIFISGHLGNWEMVPLFFSCYFQMPIASVARQLQGKTLNRLINSLRTRFGNIILDKKGALPKMVRLLKQGGLLGILIDQGTTRPEGVEISFFDHTVTATPAPALLARRYNCRVVPMFCVREADHRLTLVIEPPLVLQKTKDTSADLQANTQIMNHAVEKVIKRYPDQWLWFHKRWKQHYPYLYPEDMARRARKRAKRKRKHLKNRPHGKTV